MNKESIVQKMVEVVEVIENSHFKNKFSTDQSVRKNVVKAILDELEKEIAYEDK